MQDDGNVVVYAADGRLVTLYGDGGEPSALPLGQVGNASGFLYAGQVLLPGDRRVNSRTPGA